MSHYTFLAMTDQPVLYPSYDPDYDQYEQVLSCDCDCIPVLWIGLFRIQNWFEAKFQYSAEHTKYLRAPLVACEVAVKQLREAVPYLNQLLATEGPLDDYAELLAEEIDSLACDFITIEMEELLASRGAESLYADFQNMLLFLEQGILSEQARQILLRLSWVIPDTRFPALDRLAEPEQLSDDECWNLVRLLGDRFCRPVPWELVG